MSTAPLVQHDERTVAVENTGYKWAYILITFALLVDVAYRGMVRQEAAWDLLALVIVGGFVCQIYQARQKTVNGWLAVVMVCSAVVCAAFIAAMYKFHLLH